MCKMLRLRVLLGVAFLVLVFLLALLKQPSPPARLEAQSVLPTRDSHWCSSSEGCWIHCGLPQSPVWLDIPSGFISEGGIEFRCDPTGSLSQSGWATVAGAWDDQGYLIGFWPTQTQIVKPLSLVFEIDPARANGICSGCFFARYYDPGSRQWRSLSTTYDVNTSRVYVQIAEYLTASGFPNYADRFLVALFAQPAPTPAPTDTPVATPTSMPMPTQTPTDTPTVPPTSTPPPMEVIVTPSPTPSPTRTAVVPTSIPGPSPTVAVPTSAPTRICAPVGVFVPILAPLALWYSWAKRKR
jgi:hypothetical protein